MQHGVGWADELSISSVPYLVFRFMCTPQDAAVLEQSAGAARMARPVIIAEDDLLAAPLHCSPAIRRHCSDGKAASATNGW